MATDIGAVRELWEIKNDARIRLRWNDSWLYVRSGALRLRALRTRRTHIALRGRAKLFWKVDWAAKWVVQGVDIEGAGKDHSTKGGSRDVAKHIAKDLFGIEPPFDIPYEFFLVGGKKMSSSKGRGSSARDMAELFPAPEFRLTLIGKDITQQIDVDPEGDAVPRMYDWYDELAEKVRDGVADDFTRLYALAQLPSEQAEEPAHWQLRFGLLSFIVQMPHMGLLMEAEAVKGSALTDDEKALLEERAMYARFWLANYAPEQFKYVLQEKMPEGIELSEAQRAAMGKVADYPRRRRAQRRRRACAPARAEDGSAYRAEGPVRRHLPPIHESCLRAEGRLVPRVAPERDGRGAPAGSCEVRNRKKKRRSRRDRPFLSLSSR